MRDSTNTLFIGGEWRAASDRSSFSVTNPADDTVLATIADATAADAEKAIAAAADAQETWDWTPVGDRARILRGLHAAVVENGEQFADLISAESGKPLSEARAEVGYGAQFLAWFADQATQLLHGAHYTDPQGRTRILTNQRPIGPTLLITPWNFPLAMITRKLAPALAAGCTIVLKPAEQTPTTAVRLVELLAEQELPPGVVNLVTTSRPSEVSDAVFAHAGLRKISFTGSTAVGSALLRRAADRVISASMELGGNAPFIVFDDAPPNVIDEALIAKLRNGGQSCIAANRFLVQEGIADRFLDQLISRFRTLRIGDGRRPGTDVGPLIDQAAVQKVESLVQRAVGGGASVAYRAELPGSTGCFFAPTVLVDLPPDSPAYREEIFGPVATVTRFTDEREAARMANDTEAGLAAYVFTSDLARALRVSRALEYGIVGINRGLISTAAAPFGGTKASGLGREGGLHGLDEYLETQYLSLPVEIPLA